MVFVARKTSLAALAVAASAAAVSAQNCTTIPEVACDTPGFATLCSLLESTDLVDALEDSGTLTVFAPNDAAFEVLGSETLNFLTAPEQLDTLSDILLFHVTDGDFGFADLNCTELLGMLNGRDSRTKCSGDMKFQSGRGNSPDNEPQIISSVEEGLCDDSVIHIVDNVLLP